MAQEQLYQREIEESTINAWFFVSRKNGAGDEDFTPGRRISYPQLLKVPELDVEAVANWRTALSIDGPGVYAFGNGVEEIDNSGIVQLGGDIEHDTEFEIGDYTVDFVSNSQKRLSIHDVLIEIVNAPSGEIKLGNENCLVDIISDTVNGHSFSVAIPSQESEFSMDTNEGIRFQSFGNRIQINEDYVEIEGSVVLRSETQYIGLDSDVTEIRNGSNGEIYIGRSNANIRITSNTDGTNKVESTATTIDFDASIGANLGKLHVESELVQLITNETSIEVNNSSASLISIEGIRINVTGDGIQFLGLENEATDPGYLYRDSNGFLKISS